MIYLCHKTAVDPYPVVSALECPGCENKIIVGHFFHLSTSANHTRLPKCAVHIGHHMFLFVFVFANIIVRFWKCIDQDKFPV